MIPARYRPLLALSLMGAGAVVAVAGYLGVSRETEVAFQLPYFASAAVGALMLLGAGAVVLLSAQLERDSARFEELEESVRALAAEVGRLADAAEAPVTPIARPARRPVRPVRPARSNGTSAGAA